MHKEVPVKVIAWVDEGVAELVSALNEIPEIETLDSCQDDQGAARVFFRFRSAWQTVQRTNQIAKALGSEGDVGCQYDITIEYRGEYNPVARIATHPDTVNVLASAVRARVLVAS